MKDYSAYYHKNTGVRGHYRFLFVRNNRYDHWRELKHNLPFNGIIFDMEKYLQEYEAVLTVPKEFL